MFFFFAWTTNISNVKYFVGVFAGYIGPFNAPLCHQSSGSVISGPKIFPFLHNLHSIFCLLEFLCTIGEIVKTPVYFLFHNLGFGPKTVITESLVRIFIDTINIVFLSESYFNLL